MTNALTFILIDTDTLQKVHEQCGTANFRVFFHTNKCKSIYFLQTRRVLFEESHLWQDKQHALNAYEPLHSKCVIVVGCFYLLMITYRRLIIATSVYMYQTYFAEFNQRLPKTWLFLLNIHNNDDQIDLFLQLIIYVCVVNISLHTI